MKLSTLQPSWVGHGGEGISDRDGKPIPLRERIGITFKCPCGAACVPVFVPFSNPEGGGPPVVSPGGHSWTREGNTFETLTLTPSIQRVEGCRWHGYVTNGEVRTV